MGNSKSSVVVSVMIIALGAAWLLNTIGFLPGVDWIWTGGLGVVGVLVIAAGGLNKGTLVVGPFLIIGSIFSILRQTGRMRVDVEVPLLVMIGGALLLLTTLLGLKTPGFLQKSEDPKTK